MNPLLRERVLVPLAIILACFVGTEVLVFSYSRVLLASGKTGAVIAALGIALVILLGGAFIAARPRLKSGSLKLVLILGAIAVVLGGVLTFSRAAESPHHEGSETTTTTHGLGMFSSAGLR